MNRTGKRRNKFEIMLDMLKALIDKGKLRKTKLFYVSELSHKAFKKYLIQLEKSKLISQIKTEEFIITKKGRDFYENLTNNKELMGLM